MAPKPIPLTSEVTPSRTKNAQRARRQATHREPESAPAPDSASASHIRSKATIAQVIRQARSMSASASRPRITAQAVVAWIAPASTPIPGP